MSDRAADCGVMFRHLGIDSSKLLKMHRTLILCSGHAIDKVFRRHGSQIGVQNLMEVAAREKRFRAPVYFIHTLGLIALAKLLPPSHAADSLSLYVDYKWWMANKGISHDGFRGKYIRPNR